jgi:tRNA-dihydrouridine synthase A
VIENKMPDRRFAVAPMMDWTDRHCRVFHRLLTRRARLYTEMLTTGAIIHGDRKRLLGFDASEHPVALQLGGSDARDLATSAKIGEDFGYDEINLNVGCPSDRVKDGRFGACLMAEPELVAAGVAAMKRAVNIPVTVKCRIGIDDQDPEVALDALARGVIAAGADALIVHARKAWLSGLSPRENRDVPPLDYDRVYRLKSALPDLPIIINGGIGSLAEARAHLARVDGVMLGRAAYREPWQLLTADPELFGEAARHATMKEVLAAMTPYIERELAQGTRLHSITRHFVGAFHAVPGARAFRRHLAEHGVKADAGIAVLREAIALVEDRSRPRSPRELRIAAQHQMVGADFPALQPIQKTHAEQVGLHLSLRHHQRRHRALDQLADREPVERQPRRLGAPAGSFDVDVVLEHFERQAGGLGGLIGQHDGGGAGIDHHRRGDAVDLCPQRELAALAARDLHGARGAPVARRLGDGVGSVCDLW